jgi:hypothetical protein
LAHEFLTACQWLFRLTSRTGLLAIATAKIDWIDDRKSQFAIITMPERVDLPPTFVPVVMRV